MKNRWFVLFYMLSLCVMSHGAEEVGVDALSSWIIVSEVVVSGLQEGVSPWQSVHEVVQNGFQAVQRFGKQLSFSIRKRVALAKADPLLWAINQGDVAVVRYLVREENYPVNEIFSTKEMYPIFEAVLQDDLSIVRCLVENGAEYDADSTGPFHVASFSGRIEIMRFLVDSGVRIDAGGELTGTPLHATVVGGHLDAFKYLWGLYKARFNDAQKYLVGTPEMDAHGGFDTVLTMAVKNPDIDSEIVKHLIDEGAILNATFKTALCMACSNHRVDVVRYLVSKGADVNSTCDNKTPLQYVFIKRRDPKIVLELVRILIENGARVNVCIGSGRTLLHEVCKHAYFSQVVRYMLECGANANVSDDDGRMPLHEAAGYGCCQTIRHLLAYAADIAACDLQGNNSLHIAAINRQLPAIKILLQIMLQDHVQVKNKQEKTPLLCAASRHYAAVVCHLAEYYRENGIALTEDERSVCGALGV